MKTKIFLLNVIALLCSESVCAQNYKPVDNASEVKFTAENLGIDLDAFVRGLKGTIIFNPSNLNEAVFNVSVDATSIHSETELLATHLKNKKEYFYISKYPTISFVSTTIRANSKNESGFIVTGLLTIKDVTKSISFPFTTGIQNNGLVFSANFKINRKDFNLGGGFTVSEIVDVSLKVLAQ